MKPILFNTDMVRALIDGRKTNTRRPIKPQPTCDRPKSLDSHFTLWWGNKMFAPKYKIGEILYVRETFYKTADSGYQYFYKADPVSGLDIKWRPSIHMPKEAARLFLRVADVRTEKVQDITLNDIEREGLYCDPPYSRDHFAYAPGMFLHWTKLWDSVYGNTINSQDNNPWVWVYEFEVISKAEAEEQNGEDYHRNV